MTNNIAKIREALECAKSAARFCALPGLDREADEALAALAELEKAAAPQFVASEIGKRVFDRAYGLQSECGEDTSAHEESNAWLTAWRAELGPALGLVELKEPTPEECERILDIWVCGSGENVDAGRAMFNAVRAVLWPKEGL